MRATVMPASLLATGMTPLEPSIQPEDDGDSTTDGLPKLLLA